jgi:hypothetical protein
MSVILFNLSNTSKRTRLSYSLCSIDNRGLSVERFKRIKKNRLLAPILLFKLNTNYCTDLNGGNRGRQRENQNRSNTGKWRVRSPEFSNTGPGPDDGRFFSATGA